MEIHIILPFTKWGTHHRCKFQHGKFIEIVNFCNLRSNDWNSVSSSTTIIISMNDFHFNETGPMYPNRTHLLRLWPTIDFRPTIEKWSQHSKYFFDWAHSTKWALNAHHHATFLPVPHRKMIHFHWNGEIEIDLFEWACYCILSHVISNCVGRLRFENKFVLGAFSSVIIKTDESKCFTLKCCLLCPIFTIGIWIA